jgi:hypothetical protein
LQECLTRNHHNVALYVHCFSQSLFKVYFLHVLAVLTFTNSALYPHSVFMCFVWIWEQTAIISLYSINWLVFITKTECVYCAVRSAHTGYLCVLCGSENKQRLFHCAALIDWFL